jgi:hypothetical protein
MTQNSACCLPASGHVKVFFFPATGNSAAESRHYYTLRSCLQQHAFRKKQSIVTAPLSVDHHNQTPSRPQFSVYPINTHGREGLGTKLPIPHNVLLSSG